MRNANYSVFLFSTLTPNVIITSVKNKTTNKKYNDFPLNSFDPLYDDNNNIKKKTIEYRLNISRTGIDRIKNLRNVSRSSTLTTKNKNTFSYKNFRIKNSNRVEDQKSYNDLIVIPKQRLKSSKSTKNNLLYKTSTIHVEPYKQYLLEKNEIESIKNAKETEMKYYLESKRQQQLKRLHEIKTKYQGYDFSRQKTRESFVEILMRTKSYKKPLKKSHIRMKKIDNENAILRNPPEEVGIPKIYNERKYLFSGNGELQPTVKYAVYNDQLQTFYKSLRDNPDYNFCSPGTMIRLKTNMK